MRGSRGCGWWVVVGGMLVLPHAPARAESVAPTTLPSLALEPAPAPSIWHGLTVGTEVIALSSKHGGGIGGDVFAGYDRVFGNGLVLGLQGSTGYVPAFGSRAVRGFDFAAADVKVGYDLGGVMPFVTAGLALARPHLGATIGAPGADNLNLLLNGGGETRALTRVGAGVDYAVTNDLTVGVAISAVRGRDPFWP